jgi:hypothetical protein
MWVLLVKCACARLAPWLRLDATRVTLYMLVVCVRTGVCATTGASVCVASTQRPLAVLARLLVLPRRSKPAL